MTFPNSKYDDQVDATSQALDWIKRASRFSIVLDYNWRNLVLGRYGAGHPAVAIAAQFELPIAQVRNWIEAEQKRRPQPGLAALETLMQTTRELCGCCGKELGYDTPIRQWEVAPYEYEKTGNIER